MLSFLILKNPGILGQGDICGIMGTCTHVLSEIRTCFRIVHVHVCCQENSIRNAGILEHRLFVQDSFDMDMFLHFWTPLFSNNISCVDDINVATGAIYQIQCLRLDHR